MESAAPSVRPHPTPAEWVRHTFGDRLDADGEPAGYYQWNSAVNWSADGNYRPCAHDCYDSTEDDWQDCDESVIEREDIGLTSPCSHSVYRTPKNVDVWSDPPDGVVPLMLDYYLEDGTTRELDDEDEDEDEALLETVLGTISINANGVPVLGTVESVDLQPGAYNLILVDGLAEAMRRHTDVLIRAYLEERQ